VNGDHPKQKAMECTFGKMEISTRESGSSVSSTGKEQTSLQMETCILENTKKESPMVKVSILGKMGPSILENSRMG
jgi:hypothetical protein